MNRQEKENVIKSVKHDFETSQAAFIVAMQGMTVESVQKLRKELKQKQGSIKVAKNTLLKKATHDIPGLDQLAPYFKEQIGIIFAYQEPQGIAKTLFDATKENEKLKLIGGALQSKVINKAQIEHLATLPSREVLLAQLLGTMKAPVSAYVNILNQLVLRLLWVLKSVEEQKKQ